MQIMNAHLASSCCACFVLLLSGCAGEPPEPPREPPLPLPAGLAQRPPAPVFRLEVEQCLFAQSTIPPRKLKQPAYYRERMALSPLNIPGRDILSGRTPRVKMEDLVMYLNSTRWTNPTTYGPRGIAASCEGVLVTPDNRIVFWSANSIWGMKFSFSSNECFSVHFKSPLPLLEESFDPKPIGPMRVPGEGDVQTIRLNPQWEDILSPEVLNDTAARLRQVITNGKVTHFSSYVASGVELEEHFLGINLDHPLRDPDGALLTRGREIYFWVLSAKNHLWLQDAEGRTCIIAEQQ